MTVHRHQLEAATDALRLVLKFDRPADAVLHHFFREHRELGQHDRSFVAESVFGLLRHRQLVEYLAKDTAPRRMLLAYLARLAGTSLRELAPSVSDAEADWLAGIKAQSLDALPLAMRTEFPDWLIEKLKPRMGEADMLALGRALQQPAPLDLRVNTQRGDRQTALRELAATGVAGEATPFSPVGIRVRGRTALNRHPLFLNGTIEVQDEGSQLLAYLVAPKRHEMVVDFCAGAGGKSLQLGAMMRSHGRVYAFDTSAPRLARLKPRLKRSGLSNLYPHLIRNENDIRVKRLGGKIDRVLVDAPCSGLGTLRRNPDLKWRQSPQSIAELKAKQASILRAAATLVKPGGRLVYATCSLLGEENQDIVAAFLAENPRFALLHCGELLKQQRIGLDTGEFLRLSPHVHGTDGFFAAALEKTRA